MKPGAVLTDAAAGYRALVRYLGPLALVVNAAVVAFAVLLVVALGTGGAVAALVVSVVANVCILGLLVQTTDDLLDDDGDPWLTARLVRFRPFVSRLGLAALLLALPLVPGFVLGATGHALAGMVALLAGLVALTFCVLVVPLIVIEDWSVGDAFFRSRELVAGDALKVFAVLAAAGLLTGVASFAVRRIVLALTDSAVGAAIASGILQALFVTPLLALVVISIYYALRDSVDATATVSA